MAKKIRFISLFFITCLTCSKKNIPGAQLNFDDLCVAMDLVTTVYHENQEGESLQIRGSVKNSDVLASSTESARLVALFTPATNNTPKLKEALESYAVSNVKSGSFFSSETLPGQSIIIYCHQETYDKRTAEEQPINFSLSFPTSASSDEEQLFQAGTTYKVWLAMKQGQHTSYDPNKQFTYKHAPGAAEAAVNEKRLKAVEIAKKEAEENLTAKETELAEANKNLTAKETELAEANKNLTAKETELAEANKNLTAKETELAEANKNLTAKETELAEANKNLTAKETELAEANKNLTAKETELKTMQAELKATEEAEKEVDKQIKKIREAREAFEETVTTHLKGIFDEKGKTLLKEEEGKLREVLNNQFKVPAGASEWVKANLERVKEQANSALNTANTTILTKAAVDLRKLENVSREQLDKYVTLLKNCPCPEGATKTQKDNYEAAKQALMGVVIDKAIDYLENSEPVQAKAEEWGGIQSSTEQYTDKGQVAKLQELISGGNPIAKELREIIKLVTGIAEEVIEQEKTKAIVLSEEEVKELAEEFLENNNTAPQSYDVRTSIESLEKRLGELFNNASQQPFLNKLHEEAVNCIKIANESVTMTMLGITTDKLGLAKKFIYEYPGGNQIRYLVKPPKYSREGGLKYARGTFKNAPDPAAKVKLVRDFLAEYFVDKKGTGVRQFKGITYEINFEEDKETTEQELLGISEQEIDKSFFIKKNTGGGWSEIVFLEKPKRTYQESGMEMPKVSGDQFTIDGVLKDVVVVLSPLSDYTGVALLKTSLMGDVYRNKSSIKKEGFVTNIARNIDEKHNMMKKMQKNEYTSNVVSFPDEAEGGKDFIFRFSSRNDARKVHFITRQKVLNFLKNNSKVMGFVIKREEEDSTIITKWMPIGAIELVGNDKDKDYKVVMEPTPMVVDYLLEHGLNNQSDFSSLKDNPLAQSMLQALKEIKCPETSLNKGQSGRKKSKRLSIRHTVNSTRKNQKKRNNEFEERLRRLGLENEYVESVFLFLHYIEQVENCLEGDLSKNAKTALVALFQAKTQLDILDKYGNDTVKKRFGEAKEKVTEQVTYTNRLSNAPSKSAGIDQEEYKTFVKGLFNQS